jgi:hypothetical protein
MVGNATLAIVSMLKTELRDGNYTSPKFLRCSLVEAMGLPRGSNSIYFSLISLISQDFQNS